MKKISILLVLVVLTSGCLHKNEEFHRLTDDGGWCWFSDPRAIVLNDKENTMLTGWVKSDGSIEACLFNIETGRNSNRILFPDFEKDDHDNPVFTELPGQKLMAFYSWHSSKDGIISQKGSYSDGKVFFDRADTLYPSSRELLEKYPKESFTYANPVILSDEGNRLYCFGRWTGFKPNMIFSDDLGKSWSEPFVLVSTLPFDPGNRPYVKYFSDGNSSIHIVFTDGHPRNEALNSVYYMKYENGKFFRIDGSEICDISGFPVSPSQASLVYRPDPVSGRAWIWDIKTDEQGSPVIAYSRHPSENDHRYHYAFRKDNEWVDIELCKAGKWFPQTPVGEIEREPHYSGGLSIHPSKPGVLYLSREINGVFEIERWELKENTEEWEITSITSGSRYDNVRPVVPLGLSGASNEIVCWMQNKYYRHYTDYRSSILMKLVEY